MIDGTPSLGEARDLLCQIVGTIADLQVFSVLPEIVTPPFAFVAPSEPYVDFTGASLAGAIAHFQVGGVVEAGTNDKRARDVDELALQIVAALRDPEVNEHGFQVESVDRPGSIVLPSGQTHLAVPINVWVEIHL